MRCQLPVSVDDSISLVSMEGIATTEVEGQRAHALQVEVALQSDVGEETGLGHAEIVVVTFRIPLGRDIEAETMGQFDVILPADNEPRVVERNGGADSRGRLEILYLGDDAPCRMPAADDGACRQLDAELVVILPAVDGTHKADYGIF